MIENICKKEFYSKAQFISATAHEIRGPITNMISIINMDKSKLKDLQHQVYSLFDCLKEKYPFLLVEEYLNVINLSFEELENDFQLVDCEGEKVTRSLININKFFELKLNGLEPNLIEMSIEELISTAASSLIHNSKHVSLFMEIEDNVPKSTIMDYKLLNILQIILNNAVRFSHFNDQVNITAKLNENAMQIQVQDKGIGMSKLQMENLLNNIFNFDGNQAINYKKLSLQLSIAKLQMDAIGGKIEIQSEIEKGTCVILKFPFEEIETIEKNQVEEFNITEFSEDETPCLTLPEKLKILLIEDDHIASKIEKQQLEKLGHDVTLAYNGETALKLLSSEKFDLAFVDITLPDINGIEIIRRARDTERGAKVTYVAATSHHSNTDIDHFFDENFVTVILKPTTIENFKDCIEAVWLAVQTNSD